MAAFPHPERLLEPGLDFDRLALEVWEYQRRHNPVMARFTELLGEKDPVFMPIRFFRDFEMKTGGDWDAKLLFESSGTTGQVPSRHLVRDPQLYDLSLLRGFQHFYGVGKWAIFALLPSYLERSTSSLVYMVRHWIEAFGLPGSGFYLSEHEALAQGLEAAAAAGQRILLIGVTFGLLDFVEGRRLALPDNAVVMETGGMKGRRRELLRTEVHAILRESLGVGQVHSEYGMTELLSQAYAFGGERFACPPWMRVVLTDLYVPGRVLDAERSGRINVVDLANVHSCSFIQTDDLGRLHPDGSFEVLGRLDHAEMRGCNLMVD